MFPFVMNVKKVYIDTDKFGRAQSPAFRVYSDHNFYSLFHIIVCAQTYLDEQLLNLQ